MDDSQARNTVRSLSVINLILGAWLIISPYVLGYSTHRARWDQTIAGIVVLLLALWRLADIPARWTSWINALVGLWMIVAPFALNYVRPVAYWNEIIVGAVVLILALSNANMRVARQRHHAT